LTGRANHFPFVIFYFPFVKGWLPHPVSNEKCDMTNGKWKMENV